MFKTVFYGSIYLLLIFFCLAAQSLEEGVLQLKYYRYRSLYQSRVDSTVSTAQRILLADLNRSLMGALRERDFLTADILLDEALELVLALPEPLAGPDSIGIIAAVTAPYAWENAVMAGAEYSQYDSTYKLIPLVQVQTELKFPVKGFSNTLSGYIKYRPEKSITCHQFAQTEYSYRKWSFNVHNDFLYESEQDTSLTGYLEDNLEGELRFQLSPRLAVGNRNTLTLRRYSEEDSSNYNYAANYNKTFLRLGDPEGLNLDACAEHEYRYSRLDRPGNYQEFSGQLQVDKYFGWTNRISVGSEHCFRDYAHPTDTGFFINDYLETLLYMEGMLAFWTRWRVQLSIDQEFRIYRLNSPYTPDTQIGRIVPGLVCDVFEFLTLGCNLHYEEGYFTHPDTNNPVAQDYANGEDYRSLAVEATLDVFKTGRLFLNVSDKYEFKQFHHPEQSYLNQNSRTNSFVIFMTWTIMPLLELSVSTFDDLDNAEKKVTRDITIPASQSVLKNYSAELVFKF